MPESVEIDVVESLGETGFRRRLAVLVGAAAVVAAALGVVEHTLSAREERASAQATQLAADVTGKIAASGILFRFQLDLTREVLGLNTEVEAGKLIAQTPLEQAQLDAARVAVGRMAVAARQIVHDPTAASGLDATTLAALTTPPAEQTAESLRQAAAADRAHRYGQRSGRAVLGLSFVAIAATLLGLGGVLGAGRAGTISLVGGAAALALALAAGFVALL